MNSELQPEFFASAKVTCSNCGNVFETGSTSPELRVEVCSKCHPFYTGSRSNLTEKGGRVARFNERASKSKKIS